MLGYFKFHSTIREKKSGEHFQSYDFPFIAQSFNVFFSSVSILFCLKHVSKYLDQLQNAYL